MGLTHLQKMCILRCMRPGKITLAVQVCARLCKRACACACVVVSECVRRGCPC
jgi:hypothetical protein